jgi:hypothetical protein
MTRETTDTAHQDYGNCPPVAEEIDAACEVLGATPDNVREQAWR